MVFFDGNNVVLSVILWSFVWFLCGDLRRSKIFLLWRIYFWAGRRRLALSGYVSAQVP